MKRQHLTQIVLVIVGLLNLAVIYLSLEHHPRVASEKALASIADDGELDPE